MPLTSHKRRDLLRIERSRDVDTITAAVIKMLRANPSVDLLEVEMTLRAAASTAFVVATGSGFRIVIGVQTCSAELAKAGMTPDQNRAALADRRWRIATKTFAPISVEEIFKQLHDPTTWPAPPRDQDKA